MWAGVAVVVSWCRPVRAAVCCIAALRCCPLPGACCLAPAHIPCRCSRPPPPARRAVQLRPQDARMWNAMGHCYQQEQLALLDAAIRCHRRALPYDKEGVAVHELVSEA